jgi:hypothetical protein
MSLFSRLLSNRKRHNTQLPDDDKCHKSAAFSSAPSTGGNDFDIVAENPRCGDSYLYNAWVNIAVNILIRNIARADFVIKKEGDEVTSGPLYALFRGPNAALSRYDLWKETAAWWNLEGEAFWWFGPEYTGGLPKELYVLNPRKLHHEEYGNGEAYSGITHKGRRWFYRAGTELIPILSDELIHFRDWNLHGLTSCSTVPVRLRPLPCASMRTFPPVGRRGLRHKSY